VSRGGRESDPQFGGDLLNRFSIDDEVQHFALARGESRQEGRYVGMGDPIGTAAGVLSKGSMNKIDNRVVIDGLLDKVERPLLISARAGWNIPITRDKNDRMLASPLGKGLLQLETVHAGHAKVDHQATWHAWIIEFKKLLRRLIGIHLELGGFKQPSQRLERGGIIVHKEYLRVCHCNGLIHEWRGG
jgi:hypothetical protein